MKFSKTISTITLAVGLSMLAGQVISETVKTAGVACWTGDIEYMGTSKKDTAWVWTIDFTYIPDDKNMENTSSGRCLGSGGLVDGKPDVANQYCIINRKDGNSYMNQGQASAKGSKSMMFGGTGSFAEVVGGFVGSERIDLPADDGKLAGCRALAGEYTLK